MRLVALLLLTPAALACDTPTRTKPAPASDACPAGASRRGGQAQGVEYCESSDRKRQGPFRYWRPGEPHPSREGTYADGLENGAWISRWPNGFTWEAGQFAHGKRVGDWSTRDEQGRLQSQRSYDSDGRLHGKQLTWTSGTFHDATCYVHGDKGWVLWGGAEEAAKSRPCPE